VAINYDKTAPNVVFGANAELSIEISSGAIAGLATGAAFISSLLFF